LTFFGGARFYISARTPNSNKLHISAMGRLGMGLLICALRKSACLLFTETARGRKYEIDVRTRKVCKKIYTGQRYEYYFKNALINTCSLLKFEFPGHFVATLLFCCDLKFKIS
jgi:hypothetical protein